MKALELFKALADESRLQIVSLLMQKPYCVEDLAESLSLAVSTVSAHLKKLQQAGIVYPLKQQYYSIYHLKKEMLEMKLNDMIEKAPTPQMDRLTQLRNKVIETYFEEGKLKRLPTQNKKRWIVYQEIISLFEPGRNYPEKEINEIIKSVHEDYCLIRRELVEEGVLARSEGIYHIVPNYQDKPGFYQKIWLMSEEQLKAKEKE